MDERSSNHRLDDEPMDDYREKRIKRTPMFSKTEIGEGNKYCARDLISGKCIR